MSHQERCCWAQHSSVKVNFNWLRPTSIIYWPPRHWCCFSAAELKRFPLGFISRFWNWSMFCWPAGIESHSLNEIWLYLLQVVCVRCPPVAKFENCRAIQIGVAYTGSKKWADSFWFSRQKFFSSVYKNNSVPLPFISLSEGSMLSGLVCRHSNFWDILCQTLTGRLAPQSLPYLPGLCPVIATLISDFCELAWT